MLNSCMDAQQKVANCDSIYAAMDQLIVQEVATISAEQQKVFHKFGFNTQCLKRRQSIETRLTSSSVLLREGSGDVGVRKSSTNTEKIKLLKC